MKKGPVPEHCSGTGPYHRLTSAELILAISFFSRHYCWDPQH